MIIESLDVDQHGIWRQLHLAHLNSGLNVIRCPDLDDDSSLYSFLQSVLGLRSNAWRGTQNPSWGSIVVSSRGKFMRLGHEKATLDPPHRFRDAVRAKTWTEAIDDRADPDLRLPLLQLHTDLDSSIAAGRPPDEAAKQPATAGDRAESHDHLKAELAADVRKLSNRIQQLSVRRERLLEQRRDLERDLLQYGRCRRQIDRLQHSVQARRRSLRRLTQRLRQIETIRYCAPQLERLIEIDELLQSLKVPVKRSGTDSQAAESSRVAERIRDCARQLQQIQARRQELRRTTAQIDIAPWDVLQRAEFLLQVPPLLNQLVQEYERDTTDSIGVLEQSSAAEKRVAEVSVSGLASLTQPDSWRSLRAAASELSRTKRKLQSIKQPTLSVPTVTTDADRTDEGRLARQSTAAVKPNSELSREELVDRCRLLRRMLQLQEHAERMQYNCDVLQDEYQTLRHRQAPSTMLRGTLGTVFVAGLVVVAFGLWGTSGPYIPTAVIGGVMALAAGLLRLSYLHRASERLTMAEDQLTGLQRQSESALQELAQLEAELKLNGQPPVTVLAALEQQIEELDATPALVRSSSLLVEQPSTPQPGLDPQPELQGNLEVPAQPATDTLEEALAARSAAKTRWKLQLQQLGLPTGLSPADLLSLRKQTRTRSSAGPQSGLYRCREYLETDWRRQASELLDALHYKGDRNTSSIAGITHDLREALDTHRQARARRRRARGELNQLRGRREKLLRLSWRLKQERTQLEAARLVSQARVEQSQQERGLVSRELVNERGRISQQLKQIRRQWKGQSLAEFDKLAALSDADLEDNRKQAGDQQRRDRKKIEQLMLQAGRLRERVRMLADCQHQADLQADICWIDQQLNELQRRLTPTVVCLKRLNAAPHARPSHESSPGPTADPLVARYLRTLTAGRLVGLTHSDHIQILEDALGNFHDLSSRPAGERALVAVAERLARAQRRREAGQAVPLIVNELQAIRGAQYDDLTRVVEVLIEQAGKDQQILVLLNGQDDIAPFQQRGIPVIELAEPVENRLPERPPNRLSEVVQSESLKKTTPVTTPTESGRKQSPELKPRYPEWWPD